MSTCTRLATLLIAPKRSAISARLACTRERMGVPGINFYIQVAIDLRPRSHILSQICHLSTHPANRLGKPRETQHSVLFYFALAALLLSRLSLRIPDCRLDGDRGTGPPADAGLRISPVNLYTFRWRFALSALKFNRNSHDYWQVKEYRRYHRLVRYSVRGRTISPV
jgi:hypothetical protein